MPLTLFAQNLKRLRKREGWTQSEMTDKCGISSATWSNYENGISEPTIWKLLEISNIFGVSVETLLQEDLENKEEPEKEETFSIEDKMGDYRKKNIPATPIHLRNERGANSPTDKEDIKDWLIMSQLKTFDEKIERMQRSLEDVIQRINQGT